MILCLYVAGTFLFEGNSTRSIFVPLPAALLAFATAVVSLIAYLWAPKKYTYQLALATYVLMCVTVGVLIEMTGSSRSAYLPMWMLLAVFSGLFGMWGLSLLFAATNAGILYHIFFAATATYSLDQIIIFFLAGEMPIIVSYLIWHEKNIQDEGKSKAYDAMARELNQVANKSETVINSIAEGVVVTDGAGKIQLINPAAQQLLGWEKQDAIGLDYKSVIKIGDSKGNELPESASPIRQMLITNQSISTNDYSLTTHSGKKVLISLLVSPVGDASAGAIIVFRDITEEKEEERSKAEFVSTASHEMRTPVAAIEGYLGLALNPATAVIDDKARMFLEKAHESTQHLGRLFQDLLTVSRSEDGRLAPKPTVVDIVAFTKEIVDSLMPKAQGKGLFLVFKPNSGNTTEGDKTVSPVFYSYVDQDQLREVLNNLVDNAIKYTRQGNVTIDVTGDDSNITVSVTDTGIGVPPEDVTHLFQKFYRVDNSDTREIGGTGLGLYISRRLIESNNGHIGVTSELGKGSTFYVTLPRISHDRATELIADQQQQAASPTPVAPIPGGTPVATAPLPPTAADPAATPTPQ